MADDNTTTDNRDNRDREESKDSSTYVRKKNLISGIDNDHLIIGLLAGLGMVTAAPYIKQLIDNFMKNLPQQQLLPQPPNGGGQPQVYQQVPNPPPVTAQQQQQAQTQQENIIPAPSPDVTNPLREHERRLEEQRNYQAAMEKEAIQGSQSISMVPDRAKKKEKDNNTYVAGQNVSAGY
jgi:hypothetical protein